MYEIISVAVEDVVSSWLAMSQIETGRMKMETKVGFFSIGLDTYWAQFEGLRDGRHA